MLFPVAFQMDMSGALGSTGVPSGIGLFSSGSTSDSGTTLNYTTYLTFGFWIALVGAILIIVAATRKTPAAAAVTASTPPPPPPE